MQLREACRIYSGDDEGDDLTVMRFGKVSLMTGFFGSFPRARARARARLFGVYLGSASHHRHSSIKLATSDVQPV